MSTMSPKESFEEFRARVFADAALQAQLRAVAGADDLVALCVRLGAERGYHFTDEDVTAAMTAARRAWLERGLP